MQRTHHPLPHLEAAALLGLFLFFLKVFFFSRVHFSFPYFTCSVRARLPPYTQAAERGLGGMLRALFWSLPRKGSAA